jgi:EAL domain-containing protein (putative c-di-GMP-specific phosphodiesterase class I)
VRAGGTRQRPWDRDGSLVLAGEPRLVYQPVIDLMSGRVLGFEALLRWEHPTEGPILPQLLIPWAEANGDIVTLGDWVLAEGCRQAVEWPPSVQLAVNCSIVQLRRGVASQAVQSALEQSGLAPDRLTVEVTEHALSEEGASSELRTIAGLGVQLAVDDVGTSWNSFELLRRLAVNTIKIDESFVSGLEDAEGINRMVVETVVHLAHSSGMSTVAEGVESAKHASIVREFESDAAQGYFFAPPLEAESATMVANLADLTFPLEGTGWVDDDGWPFADVRAERLGVGNTLSHARHARTESRGGSAGGIDLTGMVLPGLPDTSRAGRGKPAGKGSPGEKGSRGEKGSPGETAAGTSDEVAGGSGNGRRSEAEGEGGEEGVDPGAEVGPEVLAGTPAGEDAESERNGSDAPGRPQKRTASPAGEGRRAATRAGARKGSRRKRPPAT